MTTMRIDAGICGFSSQLTFEDKGGYKASFTIHTPCPNWQQLNELFQEKEFNVMKELFKNRETGLVESEILDTALKSIPHVSCPVISGILKGLEVCTGLALPKDASIVFVDESA